jgi:predicted amidohydrolase YtcJ
LAVEPSPRATLTVVNARVWTGNPAQPWADALAIAGERIIAVGAESDVRSFVTPETRVVDARGGMLTPGFIDSHVHMLEFQRPGSVPPLFLRYNTGSARVAELIRGRAAALPQGAWILGEEWTNATWKGTPPTRLWLDEAAPQHPVWLTSADGESGLANSAALRLAGIARPARDSSAFVAGGPMWRVEAAIVESTRERDDQLVLEGMDNLVRTGITSVHHNNSWHQLIVFRRLHQAGRLKVRIYVSPSLPGVRRLREYIETEGRGDSWLHWGGLKGYGIITEERFYPWVSEASRAGLQIMVHIPGEAGLRSLVAVFERVRREQNLQDPRFRAEHAHNVPPDLVPHMAKAGVIASVQPPLLAHFEQRTKAGQPPPLYLWDCSRFLDQGVRIAFGSDATPWRGVASPVESIRIALERAGPDGRRITLGQALAGFTRDAAYAEFAEHEKGTLEPGKLADFALLDSDLSRLPLNSYGQVRVKLTVVGGRVVYDKLERGSTATAPN